MRDAGGRDGWEIVSLAVAGAVVASLLLALYGCGGKEKAVEAVDDAAGDVALAPDDVADTSQTGASLSDGQDMSLGGLSDEEDDGAGMQMTAGMIPVMSRRPSNCKMEDVAEEVISCVSQAYGSGDVLSVELIGNEADSDGESARASYLVHLGDGRDVGVAVSVLPDGTPVAEEAVVLRVAAGREYDVRTREYREVADGDAGQAETASNAQLADNPVGDKSESSPPDAEPLLVEDDDGNMVWVVPGDLAP